MRVSGQDDIQVAIATGHKRPLQVFQQRVHVFDRGTNKELEIGGNLVVAAAGRVQLASDIPDPCHEGTFDVHVDVFELDAKGQFALIDLAADLVERCHNLPAFLVGDQTDVGQHPGM